MDKHSLDILLVDDNKNDQTMIRYLLTEISYYNFNLDWVMTPQMALDKISQHHYDLCLISTHIDEGQSLNLLREAVTRHYHVPLILLINPKNKRLGEDTLKIGATDYLTQEQLDARLLKRMLRYAVSRKIAVRHIARPHSRERLFQIIASISDHIYVGDVTHPDKPISHYFSPHLEALTGYPTEKLMADWYFWHLLIHTDDRARVVAEFERAVYQGQSEVEYRLIQASGETIWVRDSRRVEVEIDQNGMERLMAYGVVSDITERKRQEKQIQSLTEDLERRVANRTRDLSTLYEITAIASEALNLHKTLEKALDRVLEAIKNTMGAIHTLTDRDDLLELAVHRQIPPKLLSQINFLPTDRGLVRLVIDNGAPLQISDLSATSDLTRFAPTDHESWGYLGVPMQVRGRFIGLLSLFHKSYRIFNVSEMALLASIGKHIGVAIENHHLLRQAEQSAVMEERERLARELHDAITQSLCSLTMFAEAGWEMAHTQDLPDIEHSFIRIGETAQYTLKEMRLLLHELRPFDLQRNGLVSALRQRLNNVEERANISTRLIVEGWFELPDPIEDNLYRITQEALNNALKHAAATNIMVHLRTENNHIELSVIDDGRGFYPDAVEDMGGLGLLNMHKRTEFLDGELEILSEIGKGTQIKVKVQVNKE